MAARRRSLHPYRWVLFGPAPAAGPAGWQQLGEPLRAAGLLVSLALSLALVPPLMLALVTGPGTLARALVPKDCRRWWRHHDWRAAFTRPMRHPGPPGALLQRAVRAADRDRCVGCRATAAQVRAGAVMLARLTGARSLSQASLQLDHSFPWSLGGLRSFWNFFLLCPACNLAKSNYWKYRESGAVVYHGFAGAADISRAAAILAAENRARLSLARCWRAAWAM
jgi:5-methylcytosine-specific restriction endonuclease McrA